MLRPGGRLAFTVWAAPQRGGRLLGLVLAAIRKHGRLDVPLPPAPPFFRFADPAACRDAHAAAGFGAPTITTVPIVWRGDDGAALVDGIYRSTVRTALLLGAQEPEVRERIHRGIAQSAEQARTADGLAIDNPALPVVATAA